MTSNQASRDRKHVRGGYFRSWRACHFSRATCAAVFVLSGLLANAAVGNSQEMSGPTLPSFTDVIALVKERGWKANLGPICKIFELVPRGDDCIFAQISGEETKGRGDMRGFNVRVLAGDVAPYVLLHHLAPLVGEFFVASPKAELIRAYYRTRGPATSRYPMKKRNRNSKGTLHFGCRISRQSSSAWTSCATKRDSNRFDNVTGK